MWERFVLWLVRKIFGMDEFGRIPPPKPDDQSKTMIRTPDGSFVMPGTTDKSAVFRLSTKARRLPDGSFEVQEDEKTALRKGLVGGMGCLHVWSPWSDPYSVFLKHDGIDVLSTEWEERFQKRHCALCNTHQERKIE